jgi:hypothetical protein
VPVVAFPIAVTLQKSYTTLEENRHATAKLQAYKALLISYTVSMRIFRVFGA